MTDETLEGLSKPCGWSYSKGLLLHPLWLCHAWSISEIQSWKASSKGHSFLNIVAGLLRSLRHSQILWPTNQNGHPIQALGKGKTRLHGEWLLVPNHNFGKCHQLEFSFFSNLISRATNLTPLSILGSWLYLGPSNSKCLSTTSLYWSGLRSQATHSDHVPTKADTLT